MKKRLHEIDGIRGWAALVVLMFHMTWEVFGKIFPEYRPMPLRLFLDGPFAVYVFFVLSGDALSNGFLRSGNDRSLAKMVLKRYFRLAGPILMSCALVYLLMKSGLVASAQASVIIDRQDWLGSFIPFNANFQHMVRYSLMQVFTDHTLENSYNPFLWPMSIELYGSFFVFGLLFSLKFIRRPQHVIWAATLFFAALGSYFSLFFLGLAFSILREDGYFDRRRSSRWSALSYLGVLAVAVLDALFEWRAIRLPQISIVLAGVFVFSIYSNVRLIGFFSNALSRYLGRVSFPLYITHFAVIASATSWEIVYLKDRGLLDLAHSALVVCSSVVIAFAVAEIFTRLEALYLARMDTWISDLLAAPVVKDANALRVEAMR